MFIVDSNILIEAKNVHFPLEMHPFWGWLVTLGEKDKIKIPEAVYKELESGNDNLTEWLRRYKSLFFIPKDKAYAELLSVISVYEELYGSEIRETELETMKADPWVIAHAKALGSSIISNERQNAKYIHSIKEVKIPSVCQRLDIECLSLIQFLWKMKDE